MKTDIHPDYVECTGALLVRQRVHDPLDGPALRVELCSECHPFYTGKQKLVDTGGRVERFQRRYAKSKAREEAGRRAPTPLATAARATWAARPSSRA